jgi:hypothetical protein
MIFPGHSAQLSVVRLRAKPCFAIACLTPFGAGPESQVPVVPPTNAAHLPGGPTQLGYGRPSHKRSSIEPLICKGRE